MELSDYRGISIGVGGALALFAAACAVGAGATATRAATASLAPAAAARMTEVWRDTTLRPIAQPKSIGSIAVGVVAGANHTLSVVGLDPRTGARLWQQPLTPSWITLGVRIDIEKVDDDKVAYLRPIPGTQLAELVIADARTGRDLVRSPEGIFSSPPDLCHSSRDVCVTWAADFSSTRSQYRLVPGTGEFLPNDSGSPLSARTLSKSGLLDLGDRPGNTLGLLRDGRLVWTTPVSAAFPPSFSSDYGWNWHLFADQHVLVGSVYGKPTIVGDRYIRDRASASATAGLSEATGEVLWRDLGSTFHCPIEKAEEGSYPIRCRVLGTSTYQIDGGMSFEGLDVTIEGFDVTTGKTTWSVPMGAAEALAGARTHPAIAGPTHAAMIGPSGPIILDYATGRVTRPAPEETFWCVTLMDYEFWRPYRLPDGSSRYTRPGGLLATICDSRGYSATAVPSVAATMATGARVGSYAVVATHDGYVGFRAR